MNIVEICRLLPLHGQLIFCLIVLFSIVTLAVIVERFSCFHRMKIDPPSAMSRIEPLLRKDKILEAVSLCDKNSQAITRIIKAGILKHDRSIEKITESMKCQMRLELIPLEKYLALLASIAYITPLLGFTGTILGMMDTFFRLQAAAEFLGPGDLAAGIGEALLTTAAGLVVAIPGILAHNYFRARIDNMKAGIEQIISTVSSILHGSG